MAAPGVPPMRMLPLPEAKAALAEALAEFEKPENLAKIEPVIAAGET